MSEIQLTTDLTGALSQTDLNTTDIQNIVDEFNKFQDQYSSGNIQQNQQNIIVFDDNTNRVLIGYQTVLQQWGLFVSQIGIDVTQATADQMLFSSSQNITGTGQVLVGSTDTFTTVTTPIAHGLPFTPKVTAFIESQTDLGGPIGKVQLPYTMMEYFSTGSTPARRFDIIAYFYANADATNVYLNVLCGQVDFYTQAQGLYTFDYSMLAGSAD